MARAEPRRRKRRSGGGCCYCSCCVALAALAVVVLSLLLNYYLCSVGLLGDCDHGKFGFLVYFFKENRRPRFTHRLNSVTTPPPAAV